eukprot:2489615-Pleurochrysis_carterae.AAC.1
MPVETAAMSAFHEAVVPRSSLSFVALVASVSTWVTSLAAIAWRRSRRGGLGAPHLFGHERTALKFVQFDFATHFTLFEIA